MTAKTGEVATLVGGLKSMSDLDGCYYLLENLEILSRVIDEMAEGNLFYGDDKIIAIAYWQRKVIEEIRHVLTAQDHIIMALKQLVNGDGAEEHKNVKANSRKLQALRSLTNLFLHDQIIHSDEISQSDLATWATVYDFDIKTVKSLLA